jgi:hypothetical protein
MTLVWLSIFSPIRRTLTGDYTISHVDGAHMQSMTAANTTLETNEFNNMDFESRLRTTLNGGYSTRISILKD